MSAALPGHRSSGKPARPSVLVTSDLPSFLNQASATLIDKEPSGRPRDGQTIRLKFFTFTLTLVVCPAFNTAGTSVTEISAMKASSLKGRVVFVTAGEPGRRRGTPLW